MLVVQFDHLILRQLYIKEQKFVDVRARFSPQFLGPTPVVSTDGRPAICRGE